MKEIETVIAFAVNYPLSEREEPEKEFVSEAVQWAAERKNAKIQPTWDETAGHKQWKDKDESLDIILQEGIGAFRHRSVSSGCTWTLEGVLNRELKTIRLVLDVTSESGVICRTAHLPGLVGKLVEQGMVRGTFEQTFKGNWLSVSEKSMQEKAEAVLSGTIRPVLPILFISEKYRQFFEIGAPALQMTTEAVFVPQDCHLEGFPENGICAVFPGAEAEFALNKSAAHSEDVPSVVLAAVRNYYLQQTVSEMLTFSGAEKKEFTESLLERASVKTENTQLVGELETALKENDELKEKIKELETEIRSLNAKSETLGTSLSNVLAKDEGEPLLFYGEEKDMFPEEIRDFVLEALSNRAEELQDGTRRKDVYTDLLSANHYSGEHRKIREKIENAFIGYKTMDSNIRQVLKESGLEIKSDAKHIKIAFPGDSRYMEVLPKTSSDSARAGMNAAKDIERTMF